MPGSTASDAEFFDAHGKIDGLSDVSGDTFLVTDNELSDDQSDNESSYAARASRNTGFSDPNATNHGYNKREYLGKDRFVTDFEKENFLPDNLTPDRPCTAYFSSHTFVDSTAVFKALEKMKYPPKAIRCLQRKPSGDMLITFANPDLKEEFIAKNVIRVNNRPFVVNDDDRYLVYLNIYDAPYELSDTAIIRRLQPYCEVISARRGKYANQPDVFNGMRHYRVRIIEPIPSYLRFGKFLIRLSHDGQHHTCRKCNRRGHFANECNNKVCFNCDQLGHESRHCPEDIRCSICKSTSHLARFCNLSWYKQPTPCPPEAQAQDQTADQASSNDNPGGADPPQNEENPDPDDDITEAIVERDDNHATANESNVNSPSVKPTPVPRNKPVIQRPAQASELHPSENISPSADQPSASPVEPSFESQTPQGVLDSQGLLISPDAPAAANVWPTPPTQESIDLTRNEDSRNEEHSEMETESSPPQGESNATQHNSLQVSPPWEDGNRRLSRRP